MKFFAITLVTGLLSGCIFTGERAAMISVETTKTVELNDGSTCTDCAVTGSDVESALDGALDVGVNP